MFTIKKHISEDSRYEYICPEDIFNFGSDTDPKMQHYYMFLDMVADELNYYTHNTSTSFGNPDLEFYKGKVKGFIAAKQWTWDEVDSNGDVTIYIRSKSGRTIFKIQKPNIPQFELEHRQELAKYMEHFGI